eukprot:8228-Chlamydomonas_euryale.AAC.3
MVGCQYRDVGIVWGFGIVCNGEEERDKIARRYCFQERPVLALKCEGQNALAAAPQSASATAPGSALVAAPGQPYARLHGETPILCLPRCRLHGSHSQPPPHAAPRQVTWRPTASQAPQQTHQPPAKRQRPTAAAKEAAWPATASQRKRAWQRAFDVFQKSDTDLPASSDQCRVCSVQAVKVWKEKERGVALSLLERWERRQALQAILDNDGRHASVMICPLGTA